MLIRWCKPQCERRMGVMQRCEVLSHVSIFRCWANRLCVNEPATLIEKMQVMGTVGLDAAVTHVQRRAVSASYQHKIRQHIFASDNPVLDVMTSEVAAVGATRQTARAIATQQYTLDCG